MQADKAVRLVVRQVAQVAVEAADSSPDPTHSLLVQYCILQWVAADLVHRWVLVGMVQVVL